MRRPPSERPPHGPLAKAAPAGAATKRPLWAVVGLLVVSAVTLWVGSLRGGGAAQSALAVLALTMIAAALAASGLARRLLGAVVAAAGAVTVLATASHGVPPTLPTVTGAIAGAALLAAGILLAIRGHRMPAMGSRYRARDPRGRRRTENMWDELDAGRDPTR